tara:strand:+ start:53 stop:1129 length:1077 start_codon:yes stop_codon:yes gene_type:complete
MYFKKLILRLKKSYIFFLVTVLFLNFSTSDLKSSIFAVNDIEIIEPFELNFKKTAVIDKAFREAFDELTRMTILTEEKNKLNNIKISEIKNLIESFKIKDEKFVQNSYIAKFEVNFNKQNTLLFFEKKNIFPSLPSDKNIFLLPVFIDSNNKNLNMFDNNPFLLNWLSDEKSFHLLNYTIPSEDLDLLQALNKNANNLEAYDFKNLILKYGYSDYIICLIYKEKDNIKIFSRISINDEMRIISKNFMSIDLSNKKKIIELINKIKTSYEDIWKINNQINRSVKLAININVLSANYKKNIKFENFLKKNELVNEYFIKSFDNKTINYKIIFNGSPKKFLEISNKQGLEINTSNQIWLLN